MALAILAQFVFRLSFGLALAMIVTPSKLVTSGFFRVHLWVLMGLSVLAALSAAFSAGGGILAAAVVAGVASYLGAVLWLYEKAAPGKAALWVVAAAALAGAMLDTLWLQYVSAPAAALAGMNVAGGGLLLGTTLAAMLLGHWYLNTPTMQLSPLKRLVVLMGCAIVLRAAIAGAGLACAVGVAPLDTSTWLFVAMRWLSGIVATGLLAVMTWQTLKIPNTQSATGILYVAVICSFLGELTSQLLSVKTMFPL